MNWPWCELGLSGPTGLPEIRHAYARRLKQTHPEDDPAGFQRLHEAYVLACRLARDMSEGDAEVDQEYAAEEQPAWNFDRLIGNGQSTDAGRSGSKEPDWNFDELIGNEQSADTRRPRSKEPNWDFDKLLQGNGWGEFADLTVDIEEWREMRRLDKMLDKLRKAHPHRCRTMEWKIWGRAGGRKAERAAALKLLSQFEGYLEEGADALTWKVFLLSGEFRYARYTPDLVLGLEEILASAPSTYAIPREEIAMAFGFRAEEPGAPEYWPLYRLILGERANRTIRKNVVGWLLVSAFSLALVIGLVVSEMRPSQSAPAMPPIESTDSTEVWQDRVCDYLSEDFGETFRYYAVGGTTLFTPENGTDVTFSAKLTGERDLENGQRGYWTNYADMRLLQERINYANGWGYELDIDSLRNPAGEEPEVCYVILPMTGAGDGILELESRLRQLRSKDWYLTIPPTMEVRLGIGMWYFHSWKAERGKFDLYDTYVHYEAGIIGAEICVVIAEDLEEGFARIEPAEMISIDGESFFLADGYGQGVADQPKVRFLLAEDAQSFYCFPSDTDVSELTKADLDHGPAETRTISDSTYQVFVRDYTE